MKNCDISLRGNTLTIKIRIDEEIGVSRSGNSVLVASTFGNWPIVRGKQPTGLLLNLNLYRRNE
jgi:hypothetical protein